MRQLDRGKAVAFDYIVENMTCADRGELIHIADEYESRAGLYCLEKRVCEHQVKHGSFIYNYDVILKLILFILAETELVLRTVFHFEQSVYGFRLLTGTLRHPFCRSARGCCERYAKPHRVKNADYCTYNCSFSRSGSAREDENAVACRLTYGALLKHGIFHIALALHHGDKREHIVLAEIFACAIECAELFGGIFFRLVIIAQICAFHALMAHANYLAARFQRRRFVLYFIHLAGEQTLCHGA